MGRKRNESPKIISHHLLLSTTHKFSFLYYSSPLSDWSQNTSKTISPRKIQSRIVSHSNVTWSRSDRGMTQLPKHHFFLFLFLSSLRKISTSSRIRLTDAWETEWLYSSFRTFSIFLKDIGFPFESIFLQGYTSWVFRTSGRKVQGKKSKIFWGLKLSPSNVNGSCKV